MKMTGKMVGLAVAGFTAGLIGLTTTSNTAQAYYGGWGHGYGRASISYTRYYSTPYYNYYTPYYGAYYSGYNNYYGGCGYPYNYSYYNYYSGCGAQLYY